MPHYFIYFIQSLKDKKFYIGCTTDLQKRLLYHNTGKNKSTKHRAPFKLIYSERFEDKHTAYKREYYLKSPKGFLEKKSIIEKLRIPGPKGAPLGPVAQFQPKADPPSAEAVH